MSLDIVDEKVRMIRKLLLFCRMCEDEVFTPNYLIRLKLVVSRDEASFAQKIQNELFTVSIKSIKVPPQIMVRSVFIGVSSNREQYLSSV